MAVRPTQLASTCACLRRASARSATSALGRPLTRAFASHPTATSTPRSMAPRIAASRRHFTKGAARRSNPASDTTAVNAGPTAAYDHQVEAGIIQNDDHQRSIVAVLQNMYDQLESYTPPDILPPPPPPAPSRFKALSDWFFPGYDTQPLGFESPVHKSKLSLPSDIPPGLYLYGSVGCGKSYLMDLFYANLPSKYDGNKKRIHFHAFMVDIHQRGHRFKTQTANQGGEQDWVLHAAADLAKEARVLCFDEFQVTDIVDAMVLKRLMECLMHYGVVCVMTSNRAPDELYKNGIQREQFIPCIDLIKSRFTVQCLDSDIDYRKRPRALSKVYFSPLSPQNEAEIDKLFVGLAGASGEEIVENRKLSVWGRTLNVPASTSKAAKFTFDELCGKPLSAADYLEVTKEFETVFIVDVPQLDLNKKDMARRFILFIDAAYEAKTKLFVLSDPPIHQVFSDKPGHSAGEITPHMRATMDDLGISADKVGASSMFTGEEEVFAFARSVSRITEMGSVQWSTVHKA